MSEKFVALHDNLFVKERKFQKSIGLLVCPKTVDQDFTFGTVVSAGPGVFMNGSFVPMSVTVGDEVCFPKTMGQKVTFNEESEPLILVKESAITAKIADVDVIIEDEQTEKEN